MNVTVTGMTENPRRVMSSYSLAALLPGASVALSTVEAEYNALILATQEMTWLRYLLGELGCDISAPSLMMEDNQGAIATARNPVLSRRTKHIQRTPK